MIIRVATRASKLAIAQTQEIINLIQANFPDIICELITFKTQGDRNLHNALYEFGRVGIFAKELEEALLQNHADIAVHSLKDLPIKIPENLVIACYSKREDPRDIIISKNNQKLDELKPKTKIGTSSLRRKFQLLSYRSDLEFINLRGNIDTRLKKLQNSECDAIIIAAAGIHRLGLSNLITEYLSEDIFVPAVGQGIIVVETTRAFYTKHEIIFKKINDSHSQIVAQAERKFLEFFGSGCSVPISAHAKIINNNTITMHAFYASIQNNKTIRECLSAPIYDYTILAEELVNKIKDKCNI